MKKKRQQPKFDLGDKIYVVDHDIPGRDFHAGLWAWGPFEVYSIEINDCGILYRFSDVAGCSGSRFWEADCYKTKQGAQNAATRRTNASLRSRMC